MLHPRTIPVYRALGEQVPFQAQLVEIARNFPACFTSSSILPVMDQAISDGKNLHARAMDNASLTTILGGSYNLDDIRNAINRAQTLRNKFASEPPDTQYCNTPGPTQQQHFQTVQTVSGIYQAAAGIVAGEQTQNSAFGGAFSALIQDAVSGMIDLLKSGAASVIKGIIEGVAPGASFGIPPEVINWAAIGGLALVGFLLLSRK